MERRDLLKMGVVLGTAVAAESIGVPVFPIVQTVQAADEIALPDGVSLNPGVRNPGRFNGRGLDIVPGYRKDWQEAVSTRRPGGALASDAYDKNGFCDNVDFLCNVEWRPFNYKTLQGLRVEVSGIGLFDAKGRGFRSVVVGLYNLDPNGVSFDKFGPGPVYVENGFMRSGRIFDGKRIEETEQAIMQHEVNQQFVNEWSSSETGITGTPENARSVLAASVIRVGGRYELVRAQIVNRP